MFAFVLRLLVLASGVVTRGRALISARDRPTIQVLPPEILTLILSHLDWREKRRMTTVSRAFYTAVSAAGLCIRRSIHFPSDNFVARAYAFGEVAQHAARYDCLVSLTVSYFGTNDSAAQNPGRLQVKKVVEVLSPILPTVLAWIVYLDITVPLESMPLLMDAMCNEAPRLRSLGLDCRQRGEASTAILPKFPSLFLGARAPNLRHVRLGSIDMGPLPLSVFSGVRRACLSYRGDFPDLHLGAHFPNAAYIQLEDFGHGENSRTPSLTLTGLSLRLLSVLDRTPARDTLLGCVNRSVLLKTIPEVHVSSFDEPEWAAIELTLPENACPLALRIVDHPCEELAMIMLSAQDLSWRRAAIVYGWENGPMSPVGSLSCRGRLTYLRLDNEVLLALLDRYVVLNAVEHIRVDVTTVGWPPFNTLWHWDDPITETESSASLSFGDTPPERFISCPRLTQLTLFAPYSPVIVDSREAALLGRALGWESTRTPRLRLHGVTMESPVASCLISQAFLLVESDESLGTASAEDWDGGLWDYCERD